jgi:nitrogen-specific signal transduction histidine kinase
MIHTGKRSMTVDNQNRAIDRCVELEGHLALGNEPTQTIDLHSLLTYDAGKSGVFDLSDISSTSLGKLLNALPVPVLLVDQWFCIAFVNHACEKLRINSKALKGSRFTDLLPNPDDATRAKTLESKTMDLLEKTFADRKPQKAEAILEIEKHRIWSRLNLRSVRLASARYIMVIIEDVTYERAKQRMSQKDEKELREALTELEHRVEQTRRELSETEQKLRLERIQHEVTKKQLSLYLENEKSNE